MSCSLGFPDCLQKPRVKYDKFHPDSRKEIYGVDAAKDLKRVDLRIAHVKEKISSREMNAKKVKDLNEKRNSRLNEKDEGE